MLRLSTGDVLRDAVKQRTDMGLAARRYMDAGELVPDEVILGIVRDYLRGEAAQANVIFDGFPRTIPQAQALDDLLAELERPLFGVFVLDVDDDALIKRSERTPFVRPVWCLVQCALRSPRRGRALPLVRW
jgi:adenylate kinase